MVSVTVRTSDLERDVIQSRFSLLFEVPEVIFAPTLLYVFKPNPLSPS